MTISFIALVFFICRSSFIGITFNSLKNTVNQDLWISIIISIICGIIYIISLKYICNYKPKLNIKNKIKYLFPKYHYIIQNILNIITCILIIMNFWNLTNLITSQFLNKTPKIVVGITFLLPIIYILKQKLIVIPRVGLILFYISITLYILTIAGFINNFNIYNLLPILENNPLNGVIPYISYNIIPMYLLLIFDNTKIKKNITLGYLIVSINLFLVGFLIMAILGINLAKLYQYSEFHILKYAFGSFINYRIENILSIQWVFDMFMFIIIGIKYLTINTKKTYNYIVPIILFIISNYIIPSIITFDNIIKPVAYIILMLFTPAYIIIIIKIKRHKCLKKQT